MTRVLLVKDGLGVGGAERQLLMLARGLAQYDECVGVVNLAGAIALECEFAAAGLPTIRARRHYWFDPSTVVAIAREIRRTRADVVHSFHWLANLQSALARKLLPPRVRPAHVVSLRSHYYLGSKGRFRARLDRLLLADASIGVANCHALLRHADAYGVRFKNTAVVYNGVRAQPAALQRPDRELRFVVLSRLTAVKRQQDVLRAAALLLADEPNARFWFVGDGPDRAWLEAMSTASGVAQRVRFMGEVANPADVLRDCDVLVLPSAHEGLPNAILEGMAVGLPIVATRVGGIPEAVEHGLNGFLVPPCDPGALASAFRALDNSNVRSFMGERSKHIAGARFGEETMVQAYRAIYERIG